jgi:hypothetical protein
MAVPDGLSEAQIKVWRAAEERKHFDKLCCHWLTNVRSNTGKKFFNYVQFISDKKIDAFGTPWQQKVCNSAMIPAVHQEVFWNHKRGRKVARETINRRKTNASSAIKAKFQGRQTCDTDWWLLVSCAPLR